MPDRKDDDVFEVNGPNGRSRTNQDRTEALGGTLQQAGFDKGTSFVSGLPVGLASVVSTTSGSFTGVGGTESNSVFTTTPFPSDATLTGRAVIRSGDTMDADGDYRLLLDAKSGFSTTTPTLTISSGDTFTLAESGTIDVPTGEIFRADLELRSDGSNTITALDATFILGVVL